MIIRNRWESKILHKIICDIHFTYSILYCPVTAHIIPRNTWYIQSFAAILWSFMDQNEMSGYQSYQSFGQFWHQQVCYSSLCHVWLHISRKSCEFEVNSILIDCGLMFNDYLFHKTVRNFSESFPKRRKLLILYEYSNIKWKGNTVPAVPNGTALNVRACDMYGSLHTHMREFICRCLRKCAQTSTGEWKNRSPVGFPFLGVFQTCYVFWIQNFMWAHLSIGGCYRYSMTYLDDDTLLFTLFYGACIESVDLSVLSQPTTYAGQCGSQGSKYEGHRIHEVRMHHPTGILSLRENLVYFSTWAHSSVHVIESLTDQVSTLSTGIPRARMLTYDPYHHALLVAVDFGIMRVDPSDGSAVWLSGSTNSGSELSDFHNARFLFPVDTVVVSDTAIITSDHLNNR